MRHIVVDATPIQPGPSGSRTRIEALLPRLAAAMPDDVLEVHWAGDGGGPSAPMRADNLVHTEAGVSCRGGGRRWLRVARHLRRRHRDAPFTHLLQDHGPVVLTDRVRVVVQIHDLRFLHGYGGWWRARYARRGWARDLRQAAGVVAVSPSVAAEATRVLALDPSRVHVAPNAVGAAFRRPPAGSARSGALIVARDEPRKARAAGVGAARAAGLEVTVVDGALPETELVRRYQEAAWLVAASLDEGFDLPVAEALACGTPVVATAIPAHEDLAALGALGLRLLPLPESAIDGFGGWDWPSAVEALREDPPSDVSPPAVSWDDAARVVANVLRDVAP